MTLQALADQTQERGVLSLLSVGSRGFLLVGVLLDALFALLWLFPFLPKQGLMILGALHVLTRIGTICCFLTWLYMRYSALPRIGWLAPAWSPALAVGWFFVPIFNLFRPCNVVQEIWDATEPDSSRETGQSWLVLGWWITFVSAPVASLGFRSSFLSGGMALLYVNVANVVAGLLAIRLVHQIDLRWRSKLAGGAEDDAGWEAVEPEPSWSEESEQTIASEPAGSEAALPPPSQSLASLQTSEPAPLSPAVSASVPSRELPPPLPRSAPVAPPPGLPVPPRTPDPVRAAAPPPNDASPQASLDELREALRGARAASRIFATITAISVTIMLVGVFAVGTRSLAGMPGSNHVVLLLALIYLGFGLLYCVPIVHQWRFALAAERFEQGGSADDLEAAFRLQGRFWAFTGGSIALLIGIELVGIGAAIVIPLLLRSQ